MPNRMIRDGILESEAVLSLPVEARWLYVTILLSADDVGLFEATPFKLARIADVRRELADRLMTMLADSDLVRLYEVNGKRFGFIPRFGQRLQIKRIKHAAPPDALLSDEPDTLNKIKDLATKTTVAHGCASAGQRKPTVAQRPEPEPEPEVEEKQPSVISPKAPRKRSTPAATIPEWVDSKAWGDYEEMRRSIRKPMTDAARVIAIKTLADLERDGHKNADVLAQSVMNSWQGLFQIKQKGGSYPARRPQQSTADRDAEAMRLLGFSADQADSNFNTFEG